MTSLAIISGGKVDFICLVCNAEREGSSCHNLVVRQIFDSFGFLAYPRVRKAVLDRFQKESGWTTTAWSEMPETHICPKCEQNSPVTGFAQRMRGLHRKALGFMKTAVVLGNLKQNSGPQIVIGHMSSIQHIAEMEYKDGTRGF